MYYVADFLRSYPPTYGMGLVHEASDGPHLRIDLLNQIKSERPFLPRRAFPVIAMLSTIVMENSKPIRDNY